MKKTILLLAICFGMIEMSGFPAQAQTSTAFKAHLFPLSRVRLLPSIFKRRMRADKVYMMRLDPDRLLAPFLKSAGLSPKAKQYGGWESTQLAGAFGGQYLAGLSQMYAATGDANIKERVDYMVSQLAKAQKKLGTGYIGGIPKGKELWKKIARGDIKAELFSLDGVWSPWYTLHMMYRGLYDAWKYTGNEQARKVLIRFSDWAVNLSMKLDDEQFAKMAQTEYCGMNAVMVDVYEMTQNQKYLELARRFNDKSLFSFLSVAQDSLNGRHVNVTIPKVIGAARQYEVGGSSGLAEVAKYFFKQTTQQRIYINGEMGGNEYFHALGSLPKHLDKDAGETCNVFNMLMLTQHLIQWTPDDMSYIRYAERALYNDILASIDPKTGMMAYYLSMEPGFFKTFGTPFNSFWCCYGTGVQNHAKYGKFIYMHDKQDLYVNLFIPSILRWKKKGMTLTQETKFPNSSKSILTLELNKPQKLTIKIRNPKWTNNQFGIKVNGKEVQNLGSSGHYTEITREWQDGDVITLSLPMKLHLQRMQYDKSKAAIMYGPIVLAGDLGNYISSPYAKDQRDFFDLPTVMVPHLKVKQESAEKWIKPIKGQPLHFKTVGVGEPQDVTLVPLYQITHQHYTVYWDLGNGEETDEIKF